MLFCTVFLAFLPTSLSAQDEIVLVSGKVVTVEKVTGETYKEVVYKNKGGSEGRRSADQVREVIHDLSSPSLEDYELGLDLMRAGDFVGAIQVFNDVLEDNRVVNRYKWVPQYAMNHQIRCMFSLADFEGVAVTVDKLLKQVPDTFFYAPALMAKAEAKALANDMAGAQAAYQQLEGEVNSKQLPERWAREAELGLVLLDPSLKGASKQNKLAQLVEKNRNNYPTVASRANVEIGNLMVQSGEYDDAEQFFRGIVEGGQADTMTEAAAFSGLGDVYYQRGLATEDSGQAAEHFSESTLAHLRVITQYREAVQLVPRAMYYAAFAQHRIGSEEARVRRNRIAAKLVNTYPRSTFATKVRQDLNLK